MCTPIRNVCSSMCFRSFIIRYIYPICIDNDARVPISRKSREHMQSPFAWIRLDLDDFAAGCLHSVHPSWKWCCGRFAVLLPNQIMIRITERERERGGDIQFMHRIVIHLVCSAHFGGYDVIVFNVFRFCISLQPVFAVERINDCKAERIFFSQRSIKLMVDACCRWRWWWCTKLCYLHIRSISVYMHIHS